jgi:hypothetical protein
MERLPRPSKRAGGLIARRVGAARPRERLQGDSARPPASFRAEAISDVLRVSRPVQSPPAPDSGPANPTTGAGMFEGMANDA